VKQQGEKLAKYMNHENYKTVEHQTLQEVRSHSSKQHLMEVPKYS
jgi:hypothetical protein